MPDRGRANDDPYRSVIDVGAALVSSLDFEAALAGVAERIAAVLSVSAVEIWRLTPDREQLVCEAAWSDGVGAGGEGECQGLQVGLAERPDFGRLVAGETLIERHLDDPDLPAEEHADMKKRGYSSALDAPLVVGDEVFGILRVVESQAVRRFSDVEREQFTHLCRLAAVGIRNADLFRRQETRNRRLMALLQSSRVMAGSISAAQSIDSVRREIVGLLEGIDCTVDVHIRRADGSLARYVAQDEDTSAQAEIWTPDSLAREALRTGVPGQEEIGTQGVRLVVPLVLKNVATGCIDVIARLQRPFGQDEVEFMQIVANQVAVSMENTRLYRAVQRQVLTDGLTALYNQRFFVDRLAAECARARRYRERLSLLMLDIDDFKDYNDVHGRQRGDAALRAFGRLLRRGLRDRIDLPCRIGGEEFALVLPRTPAADPGAILVAERLRAAVADATFRDHDDELLGRFSVSIGVAGFPDHAETPDDLIAAADDALHAAKAAGKDRVKKYELRRGGATRG